MYVFYGLTCVVERSWRFAVPLLLGRLLSTQHAFLPAGVGGMEAAYESVAVIGFWAQSFMFSSGMWIGGVIDLVPRRQLLKWVLGIQSVAVLVSCALLLTASPGNVAIQSFRSSWLFKGKQSKAKRMNECCGLSLAHSLAPKFTQTNPCPCVGSVLSDEFDHNTTTLQQVWPGAAFWSG
jgi:hypothetical protein